MKIRGFTLVEMVVVIIILGIISAVVGLFLRPTINSYLATQRRAALTDQADTALRRMGRDVRSAVPNSIRWPTSQCFEMVPTSTGGRYRVAPDISGGSMPLDTSQLTTAFDVLSPMSTTPAPGDMVVVDNQNTDDVYNTGINRATIATVTTPAATVGVSRITLTGPSAFPNGYGDGRFVVVPNNGGNPAVSYICSGTDGVTLDASGNGTGTLYRLTRPFVAAYPGACPATTGASVVATNVKSCNFEYNTSEGATQQSGFLWMQLTLTQANENVSLSYGVHVDNVP